MFDVYDAFDALLTIEKAACGFGVFVRNTFEIASIFCQVAFHLAHLAILLGKLARQKWENGGREEVLAQLRPTIVVALVVATWVVDEAIPFAQVNVPAWVRAVDSAFLSVIAWSEVYPVTYFADRAFGLV